MLAIDFESVHSGAYRLIGEGVWGRVFDLGDGTVLKCARETGGIGSGAQKLAHEAAMMRALAPHVRTLPFTVPGWLDGGTLDGTRDGMRDGTLSGDRAFTLWQRSLLVPGHCYDDADFAAFSSACRVKMIANMAASLAAFHRVLEACGADIRQACGPDYIWRDIEALPLLPEDAARMDLVRGFFAHDENERRAIHGDFNITNILFGPDGEVCGLLDFAEMRLGVAEDDLAPLCAAFPDSCAAIMAVYQRESGHHVDAARLRAALLRDELLSLLIARYRRGDEKAARLHGQNLDKALADEKIRVPEPLDRVV